jgi:chemotaxis family two-component system response regulator Rcp1
MEILLIEDNPYDAGMVREGLMKSGNDSNLTVAEDGNKAMDLLLQSGSSFNSARPDLIILDLKLPGKDGRQLLEFLKTDDRFKTTPVVVLTDSQSLDDITEAYNLFANCFIIKPVNTDTFLKYIVAIDNFWTNTVRIPRV